MKFNIENYICNDSNMNLLSYHDMKSLISKLKEGDKKALARSISIVENKLEGHEELLTSLGANNTPIIGITGPPGAGKSTLVNGIIDFLVKEDKKVGIIAIDPTSPFNLGALLGDRIRLSNHFNDDKVFIRSIATRGSLGGLSASIIEIIDVMKSADFDYIFIETVGVGQSEIEIVGIADTTVLVLVPEAGDEIQTIKSGIMEIGDIFVVNKADRKGADTFVKNLHFVLKEKKDGQWVPPILKTIATNNEGIDAVVAKINLHKDKGDQNQNKKTLLLVEKAYKLIQEQRMKDIDKKLLEEKIKLSLKDEKFNMYTFIQDWLN